MTSVIDWFLDIAVIVTIVIYVILLIYSAVTRLPELLQSFSPFAVIVLLFSVVRLETRTRRLEQRNRQIDNR